MSRRLERTEAVAALGVASIGLAPGAGHKFEVVGLSYASDSSAAVTWYLAVATLAGVFFREQFDLPNGSFGIYHGFQGLVVYEDELLYVIPVSAGTPAVTFVIDYVDVDFSN